MWRQSINESYEVSIDGQVKNKKSGLVLSPARSHNGNGYYQVFLSTDGIKKGYGIHRLVAYAFLPLPTEDGLVVDHIDRDKYNNHASNLRWCSLSANSKNQAERPFLTKPTKQNKTGELHISPHPQSDGFAVFINRKTFKHYSYHKTLEDAIKKRDEIIGG